MLLLAAPLTLIPTVSGCGGGTTAPVGGPASPAATTSSPTSSTVASGSSRPNTTSKGQGAPTSSPSATGSKSGGASTVVAQANAICIRRNRELAEVPPGQADFQSIATVASRRAAIERRSLSELRKLTPPPKAAREWGMTIAYSATTLTQLVTLARYASSDDAEGVRRQNRSSKSTQIRLSIAASRAGLRHCASVG